MAKSSFGKLFLIAAGIGGAAGIIAGLGDRAEAATIKPPPKPPLKKKPRKVASAESEQEEGEAVVGGGLSYGGPGSGGWGGFSLSSDSGSGSKGSGGGGGGSLPGSSLTAEQKAAIEAQSREYLRQQAAEGYRKRAEEAKVREAQEAPLKARQAKYRQEHEAWLNTPKGQEWQTLQKTLVQVNWARIAIKDIFSTPDRPLALTVEKFSGTDDYYPPGGDGKVLKLDRDGAFALAKKVADAFKKTRGTDVAVEWTAATY